MTTSHIAWVRGECWSCDHETDVQFVGPCDTLLGSGAVHLCAHCQKKWAERCNSGPTVYRL